MQRNIKSQAYSADDYAALQAYRGPIHVYPAGHARAPATSPDRDDTRAADAPMLRVIFGDDYRTAAQLIKRSRLARAECRAQQQAERMQAADIAAHIGTTAY